MKSVFILIAEITYPDGSIQHRIAGTAYEKGAMADGEAGVFRSRMQALHPNSTHIKVVVKELMMTMVHPNKPRTP